MPRGGWILVLTTICVIVGGFYFGRYWSPLTIAAAVLLVALVVVFGFWAWSQRRS